MENERILTIQFKLTRSKLFIILTALFVCFHPKLLGSEQLTLTTYYPSPYGGYAKLLTTDDTVLARDAGAVGIGYSSMGTSKLAVNGSVGIGTVSPTQALDVTGDIRTRNTLHADNEVRWGSRRGMLTPSQGASIELGGTGTPYIDFSNDSSIDYDARIILMGNNDLRIEGADLRISGVLRDMCKAVSYVEGGNENCGANYRVFAYYGNGVPQVYGFLPANNNMSGTGTYMSFGQDWNGTMLCCKIQ